MSHAADEIKDQLGVQLRCRAAGAGTCIEVVSVTCAPGACVPENKILVGDILRTADTTVVNQMQMDELQHFLLGAPGTHVVLGFVSAKQKGYNVTITRQTLMRAQQPNSSSSQNPTYMRLQGKEDEDQVQASSLSGALETVPEEAYLQQLQKDLKRFYSIYGHRNTGDTPDSEKIAKFYFMNRCNLNEKLRKKYQADLTDLDYGGTDFTRLDSSNVPSISDNTNSPISQARSNSPRVWRGSDVTTNSLRSPSRSNSPRIWRGSLQSPIRGGDVVASAECEEKLLLCCVAVGQHHQSEHNQSHRTDTQPAHNQPHCTDTNVDGFRSRNGLVDPSKQAVYAPAEGRWRVGTVATEGGKSAREGVKATGDAEKLINALQEENRKISAELQSWKELYNASAARNAEAQRIGARRVAFAEDQAFQFSQRCTDLEREIEMLKHKVDHQRSLNENARN